MARLGDQNAPETRLGARLGVVVEPQFVQPFEIEREAALVPVQLDPQLVLAAGGEPGRLERGQRPRVQPGGEHRGVVHGDRPGARALPGRLGPRALADEGGGGRGDARDQLAGQVLGQVHDVRAQVAERAGPGSLALQPPGQRERRVHQPVLEVTRAHVAELADPAVGHERAGQGQGGDAAVVEADHRADAAGGGSRRRGRHGLRLRQRVGERLLAQHVLARRQGRDGDLGVPVTRRDDVHELDVVAFDQSTPVRLRGRPAEPAGRRADRGRVPAAQHGHGGLQRQVEHVRRGPPGLRMGRAHERVAHHAHAEHRAVRDLTQCLLHLGARPSFPLAVSSPSVPSGRS